MAINDRSLYAYQYYLSKGYSPQAAAGITGIEATYRSFNGPLTAITRGPVG